MINLIKFFSLGVILCSAANSAIAGNSSSGGGGAFVEMVGERLWIIYDQIDEFMKDETKANRLLDFISKQRLQENWDLVTLKGHLEDTIRTIDIRFEDRNRRLADPSTGIIVQPFVLMEAYAGVTSNGSPFFVSYINLKDKPENILSDLVTRSDLLYGHELMRAAGFSDLEGNAYYLSRRIFQFSEAKRK
jgi:hypothetical protein